MNRQIISAVSSAGRAPSPEDAIEATPVQCGVVVQNGTEVAVETKEVPCTDHAVEPEGVHGDDGKGNGETLGVGGSNPSQRTNLPATFTPIWLAEDMVSLAHIYPGMRVLEPSAGRGNIVRAIHKLTAGRVTAIELNGDMIADLRDTNAKVLKQDFLNVGMDHAFDRVVMNPPKNAFPHVFKAADWLERGGRLVALIHIEILGSVMLALPGLRYYNIPPETFVQKDGGYQYASIIVWDKP